MKLLFLLFILPLISGDRIVKTMKGPVRGISLAPKKVEAFLGIPYAEPPVGPLRFAKPVPKSSWEETYNANELPATCIQALIGKYHFSPDPNHKMSEDCLYLNLWVPEGGKDLKPIMLFIHAGGFMIGASNLKVYDGATLSEHGDVIVATINYRLGSLGFFSGFKEEAPGSMGMYDQVMAIQWIKDNAKHFGGDPDNILLFGESAGSFSVSMHLISPLSRNLFKRAISQSGTAANLLFSKGNRQSKASQSIINLSGCAGDKDSPHKNPKSVIECMKALPAEKFSEIDAIFMNGFEMLTPIIGDEFLPENTVDAFNKGDIKHTELLTGVTRDEGTLMLTFVLHDLLGILGEKEGSRYFNKTHALQVLKYMKDINNNKEIEKKIRKGYFDHMKSESEYTYLKATAEFLGDFLITCSTVFQADYYSLRDNPVYFYVFEHRPASTSMAEWMGVAHFEEVAYVFGNPVYEEKFTGYEAELSTDIMDMWVAFAKTGNPNIPGGVKWPRYTHRNPKYLAIGKSDTVGLSPDNHRCDLWRKLFQIVIDEDSKQEL